jgi:ketosteroid isomerase-like protein
VKDTKMSTDNLELIRRGYDAFSHGDVATVLEVLDPEISWHVPGRSPLSGDYNGHDAVVGFFVKTQELAAGSFSIEIDDMLAGGDRVVVLCTVSAQRPGQEWSSPEVHVWRVSNGRAVEFREYQGDQQGEDEFWSR